MSDTRILQQLIRTDFPTFIERCFRTVEPGGDFCDSWYIDAMAYQLQRCASGEIRRLIINLPPRYLKSHCTTVAFPAWLLGQDPSLRVIIVCYGRELVTVFSRNIRQIMTSDWYRAVFPRTRLSDLKNTEFEFHTTRGGCVLATSVSGTLTGRGGDVIIIDDPLKAQDAHSDKERQAVNDWYASTLLSRLNNKKTGRIVLVAQRLHVDDLVGNVQPTGAWTNLIIPAIAEKDETYETAEGEFYTRRQGELLQPEREDMIALEAARRGLGSLNFSAQYQQDPQPPGGNLILREWIQSYKNLPLPIEQLTQVFSLDPAWTTTERASYSVLTRWAIYQGRYYLLEVWRCRVDMPTLKKKIREFASLHHPDIILIEHVSANLPLYQELRAANLRVRLIRPLGDKESRVAAQTARIEGGCLVLPETAPWKDEFLKEILAFPSSPHDDQVDSMSQFLEWAARRERIERLRLPRDFQRRDIKRQYGGPRPDIMRRP